MDGGIPKRYYLYLVLPYIVVFAGVFIGIGYLIASL